MERKQINLEFIFRASPAMLYKFFTSPANLIRWFCDEVNIDGETYTFAWEGSEEIAELIDDIEEERLRFQWEDADDDNEFLDIKMYRSPVTNETVLEIIDYCDDDEIEEQTQLWHSQIDALRSAIGG